MSRDANPEMEREPEAGAPAPGDTAPRQDDGPKPPPGPYSDPMNPEPPHAPNPPPSGR